MNLLNIKGRLTKLQQWLHAHNGKRPEVVQITDPAEIASIDRNHWGDLNGWKDAAGLHWAYRESIEKFRRRTPGVRT